MNFDDLTPLPVKCRQSCAVCAASCERKWFLKYRLGVVLRGGSYREAADLGTIYHRFMLEGQGNEKLVRTWVNEWRLRLCKQITAGEDLEGNLARTANKLKDLYNTAEVMARIFWERYPQPEWFKTLALEVKHECVYGDVTLSGTIDKLLLNTRKGDVWIRDHKSTGRPLAAIFAGAPWKPQGRIYRLLAKDFLSTYQVLSKNPSYYGECLPVPPVRGFIQDGIQKPGIKLCKKDEINAAKWNVTVQEAYLRRVKEWYKEKEGKTDAPVMRSRGVMFTEKIETPEFVAILDRFRRYQWDTDLNPERYARDPSGQACYRWERLCEYYDLCCTDPKQWDSLFEKKYTFKKEENEE